MGFSRSIVVVLAPIEMIEDDNIEIDRNALDRISREALCGLAARTVIRVMPEVFVALSASPKKMNRGSDSPPLEEEAQIGISKDILAILFELVCAAVSGRPPRSREGLNLARMMVLSEVMLCIDSYEEIGAVREVASVPFDDAKGAPRLATLKLVGMQQRRGVAEDFNWLKRETELREPGLQDDWFGGVAAEFFHRSVADKNEACAIDPFVEWLEQAKLGDLAETVRLLWSGDPSITETGRIENLLKKERNICTPAGLPRDRVDELSKDDGLWGGMDEMLGKMFANVVPKSQDEQRLEMLKRKCTGNPFEDMPGVEVFLQEHLDEELTDQFFRWNRDATKAMKAGSDQNFDQLEEFEEDPRLACVFWQSLMAICDRDDQPVVWVSMALSIGRQWTRLGVMDYGDKEANFIRALTAVTAVVDDVLSGKVKDPRVGSHGFRHRAIVNLNLMKFDSAADDYSRAAEYAGLAGESHEAIKLREKSKQMSMKARLRAAVGGKSEEEISEMFRQLEKVMAEPSEISEAWEVTD